MTALRDVSWICGPPDAGKSTVAGLLGDRHGLAVYHYDTTDIDHHRRLAEHSPEYARFMAASLDERWREPSPQALFERALVSFADRWPLVVEELEARPEPALLAEGFGLTPHLLRDAGVSRERCVLLLPTVAFREASLAARDKLLWTNDTRDPARARANLLARDMLLSDYLVRTAAEMGVATIKVAPGWSADAVAADIETHFGWRSDPGEPDH